MKNSIKFLFMVASLLLVASCGNNTAGEEDEFYDPSKTKATQEEAKASSGPDLSSKGIGPITSITLDEEVNQEMVAKGEEIFTAKCTACHKIDKKFIGPNPTGVLERRSPEWVMNMILNPEEMIAKDPVAKQLMIEFNGAPMANQNLLEDEARAVLEYFRTLK